MSDKELKVVILSSKNRNDKATIELLKKYKGLIRCYSFINGKIERELEQDLICKTIEAIRDFKV